MGTIPTAPETEPTRSRLVLSAPNPNRFTVSAGTLRVDRFMKRFIVIGGVGIIIAVFGICFFIVAQVVPLFQSPSVRPLQTIPTGVVDPVLVGTDEWA